MVSWIGTWRRTRNVGSTVLVFVTVCQEAVKFGLLLVGVVAQRQRRIDNLKVSIDVNCRIIVVLLETMIDGLILMLLA